MYIGMNQMLDSLDVVHFNFTKHIHFCTVSYKASHSYFNHLLKKCYYPNVIRLIIDVSQKDMQCQHFQKI